MLSFSPVGEIAVEKFSLSTELGKDDMHKCKLFIYPLQCVQTCFLVVVAVFSAFTCFSAVLELLYWEPGLPQGMPHVSKKVFAQELPDSMLRGPGSLFMAKWKVHRQTQGLYAHYLVHRWVKSLLGLLTYGAGSHKGTFVHEWTPNCCWGGNNEGHIIQPHCWYHSHSSSFIDVLSIYIKINY